MSNEHEARGGDRDALTDLPEGAAADEHQREVRGGAPASIGAGFSIDVGTSERVTASALPALTPDLVKGGIHPEVEAEVKLLPFS